MVRTVAIYADGSNLEQMAAFAADERISGFTTNPSLMRKAGIKSYHWFAQQVLSVVKNKPVSFEVLADDFYTMAKQAEEISKWGDNCYVKIPITNTRGESSTNLIKSIADFNLNITAVMTVEQWEKIKPYVAPHHIVSIFAGRIMDTGRDVPTFPDSICRMLWASPRELYNVQQATEYGYDIITLPPDLIAKLPLQGKDLTKYSLETVKQFHEDGKGIEF